MCLSRRKQRKISVVVDGDFVGKSNKASRIVNFKNLIRVPITRFDSVHSADLSVALFNAQSVGPTLSLHQCLSFQPYLLRACTSVTVTRAVSSQSFCLYRSPPNKKNRLTDSLFIQELPDLLEYANSLKGSLLIMGDFNFHFDTTTQLYTAKVLDIISSFGLCQSVSKPTHTRGHIVEWVVYREEDDLLK